MPETRMDKAKISDELEQLQLEETRERVHEIRASRRQRENRRQMVQQSIRQTRALEKRQQEACWHKKGGKGVSQLSHGNDANYAVIKHTLSHGPTIVLCQRCTKVWEPPPVALNRRGASAEDKAEYKRLYQEYVAALNFPTDNEPSGTVLFTFTQQAA
jgi:hypothetical protein